MPMESYKAPLEPEELEAIRQQIVKAGSRPICSAPPANRRAQAVASSFIVGQREAAGGLKGRLEGASPTASFAR